ncbi:amino acid ABC transporter permease [uncultured Cetobacterium sp.]|uniref:amino acid ABC transporter permease n=1 Tax=uncultured Cetobacterium sp. TaxID=527638 RepID=UPI002617C13F|nr:amino acid ABC transporter permease [uncultured Cetobacterium sp.]
MDYLETLKAIFIDGHRYQYMIQGLGFSVGVTLFSAVFGIVVGVLLALLRLSKFKQIAIIYIDLIRGTPAVVQLLILANIVFASFRDMPIFLISGIAFGINSSAYVAEIIRAGIEGLDKGQMEAARALGMNYKISMKEVIMPQAIRKILPALVSEFITLLKETSIVGFIGGVDLLRSASIITSQTYRGVEPLLMVGLIYLILVGIFTKIMRHVEKGLKTA